MYYKEYGNTGLKVSAIGLGTLRYNMDDIRAGRYEACAEIPLYAFEKGINYWDTAPDYCEDKSEIVTGIALSQVVKSIHLISDSSCLQYDIVWLYSVYVSVQYLHRYGQKSI